MRDIPGLAVNPADPSHIVEIESDTLAGICRFNTSFDGGRTWTGGELVPPPAFARPGSPAPVRTCDIGLPGFLGLFPFEGSVAFGSGQNVYATFSSMRSSSDGNSQIMMRSTDGGRTFSAAVAMDNPGGPAPSYSSPEVGVDPGAGAGGADRVWAMAQVGTPPMGGRVFVAVSDDGGVTFAAPVEASAGAPVNVLEASGPVISPDGTVTVAYRLPDANPPPPGARSVEGTMFVARSSYPGTTWERSVVARVRGYIDENDARFNQSSYPRMAVDRRNSTMYLSYMEGPPPGGRLDHFIHPDVDVLVVRSTDGGATWSKPVRVNNDPPGLGAVATGPAQRHPKVSVAPNGRVDVVWQDRRHGYRSPTQSHQGNGEARMGDTYWAYSLDGGATFSPNRRVSDKTQNLDIGYDRYSQEYWVWGPVLVPLGDDEVLFAWMDSREGNFQNDYVDIYLARTSVRAPDVIPVQELSGAGVPGLSATLGRFAYQGGPQGVLTVDFASEKVSRTVIVNEGDPGAALAGSVLSRAFLAPLLASPAGGLPFDVRAEVARMEPVGAFVLGDEGALGPAVVDGLAAAGVPGGEITRLAGATSADMARSVALAMDRRSDAQRAAGTPAFDAAVIVDPASAEAVTAAGMAASLRLPVLFTGRHEVPAATRQALSELGVTTTLVVGSDAVISDAVASSLPGATRLGGPGAAGVSRAVLTESVARGLPTNIVYVADAGSPVDAALAGAAAARTGALVLVVPGADVPAANAALSALGLRAGVDRLLVVRSSLRNGYRLVARDGGVFAFGGAPFLGSAGGMRLAQPMVGMATTSTNQGYWTVAADGGVFAFGDARFFGSTGSLRLAQPVVGMATAPSGDGYWLIGRDGGVFAFGAARYLGSTGSLRLAQPVVGMAPTPSGDGYWLVAADGGVFAFGDARFFGSTGSARLTQPVVGMAPTPSGDGYWLVAADGGVFAYGDAAFHGSMGGTRLARPVVGVAATASGRGYLLAASDGGVFAFGDATFAGSTGAVRLNQPVVAVSAG